MVITMSKRLLSALLAVLIICSVAAPTAMAAVDEASYNALVARGATRGEVAQYIADNLGGAPAELNTIPDGSLRDVAPDAPYAKAVYTLYRAGILVNDDAFNRFFPERTITKTEADAIFYRVKYANARRFVKLKTNFAAEDVFALANDAVFTLETFDGSGDSIRTASAFFINADGIAATCLHVFDNARSATATMADGTEYEVLGVVAHSETTNVALFKVDGAGFPWLPIADSETVKTGEVTYSLGAPLALGGTISKGLISYAKRDDGDREMIQFNANISMGSGGGALLDAQARVIGITSSSYSAGEALNLAEPSKHILSLKIGKLVNLREFRK